MSASLITVEDLQPALWSDPWWRLCNLYHIVNERNQVVRFTPNAEQRELYENLHYRNLILKARQMGFTTFVCVLALDQCMFNENFSAGIIAHNREDAEKFFRTKVMFAYDRAPESLRAAVSVVKRTESQVTFSNGSTLYVSTSFRGGTLQLLHVSEFGKICRKYPEKAKEIVTGAFESVAADNMLFVESTAEGMGGYFFDYCQEALKAQKEGRSLTNLDWRLHFFPWFAKKAYRLDAQVHITEKQERHFADVETTTGVKLSPEQKAWWVKKKAALLNDMGREYPGTPNEAFEQAIDGAVFAEQMASIREKGRITTVPVLVGIPVDTYWDFGVGDATTIWFRQRVGLKNHWVKYMGEANKGLDYWWRQCKEWAELHNVAFGKHFLPHDAEHRMQGEEVTDRHEILTKLGMRNIRVVQRIAHLDVGIDMTRTALPSDNWFDVGECADGIKCLDSYQYEWDDKLGRWKNVPLHNWASHGCDAWRQHAQTNDLGLSSEPAINEFANRTRESWR